MVDSQIKLSPPSVESLPSSSIDCRDRNRLYPPEPKPRKGATKGQQGSDLRLSVSETDDRILELLRILDRSFEYPKENDAIVTIYGFYNGIQEKRSEMVLLIRVKGSPGESFRWLRCGQIRMVFVSGLRYLYVVHLLMP
ncbi:hypothetical protein LSH36_76g02009 [Paralvinella palmiformis]|uniref:Uncharacterized protein n=1 Tax=Paralvinella palmiformis TaxID=53620 RepID=A0AAD9K2A3_9ANNE|nr:hypothetical protein LSH36_76g02009 [Paralvinella palmiformis]